MQLSTFGSQNAMFSKASVFTHSSENNGRDNWEWTNSKEICTVEKSCKEKAPKFWKKMKGENQFLKVSDNMTDSFLLKQMLQKNNLCGFRNWPKKATEQRKLIQKKMEALPNSEHQYQDQDLQDTEDAVHFVPNPKFLWLLFWMCSRNGPLKAQFGWSVKCTSTLKIF